MVVRTVRIVHMGHTRGARGQRRRGRHTAEGVPGRIRGVHTVAALAAVGIAAHTAAGTVQHTDHTQAGPHNQGGRIVEVARTAGAARTLLPRLRLLVVRWTEGGLDRCKRQSRLPRGTW